MNNTSKVLIALGAGLAIGGVLGILFAPEKGVEMRHKLAEEGKKIKDQIKDKVKFGKEKIEEELTRVNGKIEEALA
jgi:gas vesicle protein